MPSNPRPGLTREGCRQRQQRLRHHLGHRGVDGALLSDARYVHYFTGHWHRGTVAAAVYIPIDGPVTLATAGPPVDDVAADVSLTYAPSQMATLVDDQESAALDVLLPALKGVRRIGCDQAPRPWRLSGFDVREVIDILLALRRTKDADEICLIRRGIAGCEAAYAEARRIIAPGMNEVTIYARTLAAAIEAVGEPVGEFGNDFQAGTPGGPPRDRAVEAGELMPLDLSVLVRGYWSDMSRTFCIGGRPSSGPARAARRLVIAAQELVERDARPGTSCRQLYREVHAILDGRHGWRFDHHLGHGFGLAPHEAPRLNPHWDEVLRAGDTLTCEPGLYGPDLRGGVRIEQDYLVTESGLEKLTSFPTDL